jgi:hypothetical protein
MVHIKFTACLQTPVVSPRFLPMASESAGYISADYMESLAEQPDTSLADEQV